MRRKPVNPDELQLDMLVVIESPELKKKTICVIAKLTEKKNYAVPLDEVLGEKVEISKKIQTKELHMYHLTPKEKLQVKEKMVKHIILVKNIKKRM